MIKNTNLGFAIYNKLQFIITSKLKFTITYLVKKVGIGWTLFGKWAMMDSEGFEILVILFLVTFLTNGTNQARKQCRYHTNKHKNHSKHTKSFRSLAWNVSRHKEKCKTHFSCTFCFSRILKHPLLRTKTYAESVNRKTELWCTTKISAFQLILSNDAQFSKSRVWLMAFVQKKKHFFLFWTFQPFGLPLEFIDIILG